MYSAVPSIFEMYKRHQPLFYVGSARSGAPFHVHSLAVNVLVFGRKRWALRPPPVATLEYTRHPTLVFAEYEQKQAAAAGVLQCIQESGDILVVPDGWGYGESLS